MSLYIDNLSKTLRPDILFILSDKNPRVASIIQQLDGEVILSTKKGIQVQFKSFKQAAIAYEELRRDYVIKFAYKSVIAADERELQQTQKPELLSRNIDLQGAIINYRELVPEVKTEFKKIIEKIEQDKKEYKLKKIEKAASNLDFANMSWNQQIDSEGIDKSSDESDNTAQNFY